MSLIKSFYATVASLFVTQSAFAADANTVFGGGNASGLQLGSGANAESAISGIITRLLTLVTIIAVAYVLWAGFQIMTAGGDEEKVKSGRKTIIYVLVGIVVMWLAYWIVKVVMNALV